MATITSLNASDAGSVSRGVINTNFSNLNSDKAETSALSSYLNKSTETLDNITAGTTNKHLTATLESKLNGIEASADVTNATNVASAGAVMNTGNETVGGIKTFSSSPIVPAPTTDLQVATKKYVDDNAGGTPEGTAVKSTGETGASKFLREDGDGTCSWQAVTGSGTPGGSDTYVQFNDGGYFGGDDGLVYNKTTKKLTVVDIEATGEASFYLNGIIASSGGDSENGSDVDIQGGDGGTTLGNGGYARLKGGQATAGNSDGGGIEIVAGSKTGAGVNGKIYLRYNGGDSAVLDTESLTAERTFTFPDTTGTIALTSTVTANVSASSDTVAGKIECAIASEVTTGTDAGRAVTPDGLAGSDYGKRVVQVALNGSTALTTSDKAYFRIPSVMNGWNLVGVAAMCKTASSSGTPTFTIKNGATSILSTNLTIDASETDSSTAATAAVIDTANDGVATSNQIEVACTTAGTGTAWVVIEMVFQLP